MKKIVIAALLSLATVSTSLISPQAVKADEVLSRNYDTASQADESHWAADHPHAYADGFRQGEQSARDRKAYRPRTAGGEFARGFEDGYFNRPYTGQKVVILPRPVIYNYPNPAINFGLGFGFGGGRHRW